MRQALAAGLGFALLIAAGATGQVRKEERQKETTRSTPKGRRITQVIGSEVRVREEALGKVTDVVFDEDGCIGYLIVRDGEEFVAVPWGAIRYEVGVRTITVTTNVTREKLRAVRFRSSAWPDFYSERWMRSAGQ